MGMPVKEVDMTITVSPAPVLKLTFWKTRYNKDEKKFEFIEENGQDVCIDEKEFSTIADLEKCSYMEVAQSSECGDSKFAEFKLSRPVGGSGRTALCAKYENGEARILGWTDDRYTVSTLEPILGYL